MRVRWSGLKARAIALTGLLVASTLMAAPAASLVEGVATFEAGPCGVPREGERCEMPQAPAAAVTLQFRAEASAAMTSVETDANGRFALQLPAGNYVLTLAPENLSLLMPPARVTVAPGKPTVLQLRVTALRP